MTSEFAAYQPHRVRRSPPEGLRLRLATSEDIEACVRLLVAVRGEEPARWRPMFERTVADPDKVLIVAQVGGEIVGYARAVLFVRSPDSSPDTAPDGYYLMGLVVEESWRRHGIAQRLTQARLEWAWARTEVVWYFASADNRASLDLHAKLGFHEVTRDFTYPGLTFTGGRGVLCRVGRHGSPD